MPGTVISIVGTFKSGQMRVGQLSSPIILVSGIPSPQSFGVVTRITGGVSSSSSGVPSAQAFGTVSIHANVKVAVPGLGSAQVFGVPWIIFDQFIPVLGLGSAQAFGTTKGGFRAYLVWLHDAPCLEDDLVAAPVTALDLQPAGCL